VHTRTRPFTSSLTHSLDHVHKHSQGVISDLHVGFSRDGPEKVYVQHKLKEHGEKVFKLLKDQRGHL
jgi:sulfite reductase (NADPH) flavoprotein alpha-component